MIKTDFDSVLEWGRKWNIKGVCGIVFHKVYLAKKRNHKMRKRKKIFSQVEEFRNLVDILRTDDLPNSTDIPSTAETADKEKQMSIENNN